MPRLTRHETTVLFALALCSLAGGGLLVCRLVVTRATSLGFLPWNLFLAWIPLVAAVMLRLHDRAALLTRARAAALLVVWLIFFPNAPYLVTDFAHLRPRPGEAPLWFDIGVLMTFAWNGLLLGFVSLFWVQEFLAGRVGRIRSTIVTILVLALGAYGIYLGRFGRFNSWDVVLRPLDIGAHLLDVLVHPRSHPRALAVTLLYGALLGGAYLTLLAFARVAATTIVATGSPTKEETRCPPPTT
jgi:uncharacterized membrane protein